MFRYSLTPNFTSFTVSSSQSPMGLTCSDPMAVSAVVSALRFNSNVTMPCSGHTVMVTNCTGAGPELAIDGPPCGCGNQAAVRPCNGNWGGVNGQTCNAPSQTLTVRFH